jgi:metallo-beta-lactamase family protein
MKITFFGAAREVTGSLHMIEVNDRKLLLECGLYQGRRAETYERNLNFPFDPATVDALVLSHAHIDHCGNIPNLVKQGFTGNVWCTAATRNLATYMLMDSGHIQEQDVEYLNKQRVKEGLPPADPIYTRADATRALGNFVSVGKERPIPVMDGVEVTFLTAGHILGAAIVQLDIREFSTGKSWRVIFSGDLGRQESGILNPPVKVPAADILIMESTYGDRLHESPGDARKRLRDVINQAVRRRGKVIIPAFAVGRTQELVYEINQLDAGGDIPQVSLFVDSPLAVEATDVFRMHPEEWNETVRGFLAQDGRRNPFDYPRIEYVREVRRSKQLNHVPDPAIIISASGMAESGRILHHLKNHIEDPDNTVLLVSFQAENTLGRRLEEKARRVRIFGEEYDVRARVEEIGGYSAHADQGELIEWARAFDRARLQQVFLVHGELPAATTLRDRLAETGLRSITIPERKESFTF